MFLSNGEMIAKEMIGSLQSGEVTRVLIGTLPSRVDSHPQEAESLFKLAAVMNG